MIATGGIPRNFVWSTGCKFDNIFTIRDFADNAGIAKKLEEGVKKAVVIGNSFVGMEAAASLKGKGVESVVVVGKSDPFPKLGEKIGQAIKRFWEDKGIEFKVGSVVSVTGASTVKEVAISSQQEKLGADLVVVGVGVKPATSFIKGMRLVDGNVKVDKFLKAAEDTYAAGDITVFPNPLGDGEAHIEHWSVAQQQGQIAARNMYFGDKFEYNSVPFFWTRSFETTIGFAGSAKDYDDIIYSPLSDFETASKPKWVAFYVKGDKVIGVCACNFFNYPTAAVVLLAEEECQVPRPSKRNQTSTSSLLPTKNKP